MIKIDGVYDSSLLKMLNTISAVSAVGFDFFPKSFNFIQEYKLLELLEDNYNEEIEYFFHFKYEKGFVIEKLLTDFTVLIEKKSSGAFPMNRVFLEFSGKPLFDEYDDLERAYYVHFDHETPAHSYESAQYLRGIIIDYTFLRLVYENSEWDTFIKWYQEALFPILQRKRLKLILQRDWSDNIFPSLFEQMAFSKISLAMGHDVEYAYRKPNIELIKKELNIIEKEVSG